MHLRIGMLTPSSNTALEPATLPPTTQLSDPLTAHFSRLRIILISDVQPYRVLALAQ